MAAFVIGINENEFVHVVDEYQGVVSEIRYGAPIEEATVYSDYSTANDTIKSVKENADSIEYNAHNMEVAMELCVWKKDYILR